MDPLAMARQRLQYAHASGVLSPAPQFADRPNPLLQLFQNAQGQQNPWSQMFGPSAQQNRYNPMMLGPFAQQGLRRGNTDTNPKLSSLPML